jgi:signal transduction histidine kinase
LDEWLTGVVEEEAKKLPANVTVELSLGLEGKTVPFDPARLQRAVINMISNAVEAMSNQVGQPVDSEAKQPHLMISSYIKNDHCSIRVRDNGPGIADDILQRIREPLFTTKSFGTGLGIPAIEQIAVQHGGRLDIDTMLGVGTTFTIWMPVQQKDETEKAA